MERGIKMELTIEEAIKWFRENPFYHKDHVPFNMAIKALEALREEPKTGHWITHEEQFNALGMAVKGGVKCSECGYTTHNKLHMEIGCPYKFCPDCGCRMVETQKEE